MSNDSQFPIPESQENESQQEPTVLDLYKSVTKDWSSFFNFIRSLWDARRREELNRTLVDEVAHPIEEQKPEEPARASYFPWRSIAALLLALGGQFILEPPNRQVNISIALYVFAVGFVIWAYIKDEWHLPALPLQKQTPDGLTTRLIPFFLSIIFASFAFWFFGDGLFTFTNVTLWVLAIGFLVYAFWIKLPKVRQETTPETQKKKVLWNILIVGVLAISLFYRLYQTASIPSEPFSDHAEKILDVYDVSLGEYSVFFPRNTGREAIQMYWTLLVANVFGTGLSYLSLKLGTALLGVLTLPYIYLLGKEIGGSRVGLFALFLFGIAYWPNVISRIGLRFPLYPLFAAPTLLYLIRGLRTRNRNDFLLSGIFLGLGLHGYSPFRIVPILVVIAFIIYLIHNRSKETRQQALWWLVIIVVTSLFVFLPLLRYWIANPAMFGERAFTRLTSMETPLPGPAWQIFFSNLYRGLLMFNWDNGNIWVNSLPNRPALDIVTGALFVIGLVLLIIRYIRQRDWRDLFLLISIPVLIMPSVLSLAYPDENPALNRSGGASIAVILVSALALEGLVAGLGTEKKRVFIAYTLTGILLAASAYQNYDLVFNKFNLNFRAGAWNTSELGMVISDFRDKYGQTDTIWIVPYPHWLDTRLPGVWAGIPDRDLALFPERLSESLSAPAPKMFIFWREDVETEKLLKELYPNGILTRYTSTYENKDFFIFMVEQ
ncbi:MAG: glycosyltransferase family 39 protein [Anaerolineales bacterium]|nr:glycosyltransferase family 39 protein [Anaerolineales bacterium]